MGDGSAERGQDHELSTGDRLYLLAILSIAMVGGLLCVLGTIVDSVVVGVVGLAAFLVSVPLFVIGSVRVARSRGVSAGETAVETLKDVGRFLFWFMPP